MKQLGLIGKNIAYSFSKQYFEEKFETLSIHDFQYDIFDIQQIEELEKLLENKNIVGLNITIPYKIKALDFLDDISEEAKAIGAINTIHIKNGKRIGHNTDVFGFEKSLLSIQKGEHRKALILGNGGAAKAVKFVLNKHHIPFQIVSRKGELNFENLTKEIVTEHQLIIQCTPVGTFPHTEDCVPFPFDGLSREHHIIDLIYNPEQTQFMKNAEQFGATTSNGLLMLQQQAEKSWEIWNS